MAETKLLPLQISLICLLLAVITVKLFVDHPEWSPNGLVELRTALVHRTDERINALATP
jgi:hypothetical protein